MRFCGRPKVALRSQKVKPPITLAQEALELREDACRTYWNRTMACVSTVIRIFHPFTHVDRSLGPLVSMLDVDVGIAAEHRVVPDIHEDVSDRNGPQVGDEADHSAVRARMLPRGRLARNGRFLPCVPLTSQQLSGPGARWPSGLGRWFLLRSAGNGFNSRRH